VLPDWIGADSVPTTIASADKTKEDSVAAPADPRTIVEERKTIVLTNMVLAINVMRDHRSNPRILNCYEVLYFVLPANLSAYKLSPAPTIRYCRPSNI
jgi:hypothetical protein